MISFIIPFYNRYDLVYKCLTKFRVLNLWKDDEIVLINDASTDSGFEENLVWWQTMVAPPMNIIYHKNDKNLGFIHSMNLGAELARNDFLVFLSNDVEIIGDPLPSLREILKAFPNALIGERLIDWDGGWNAVEWRGERMIVPYLEGWLLASHREVWEKLGGFDPIYAPADMEDVDLSTTARYLGIPLLAMNSLQWKHLGAQSYGYSPQREERTRRNREKWLEKWADKWDNIFRV